MKHLYLLAAFFLFSCATGEGSFAEGRIRTSLEPESSDEGPFVIYELTLGVAPPVWGDPEEGSDDGDHGHGHAHLRADAGPHDESHDHDHGNGRGREDGSSVQPRPLAVDLLGGRQLLSDEAAQVGTYPSLTLDTARLDEGAGRGCALAGSGSVTVGEETIPWALCLSTRGEIATFDVEVEVHEDEVSDVLILLHVDELFEGIDPALLSREDDGTLLIGQGANGGAAAILEQNLAGALHTH